jgi:hypothetical protein
MHETTRGPHKPKPNPYYPQPNPKPNLNPNPNDHMFIPCKHILLVLALVTNLDPYVGEQKWLKRSNLVLLVRLVNHRYFILE